MRRPSRNYPLPLELPAVSYTGMTDSRDPSIAVPNRARMLQNVYLPPGPPGTPLDGRPGFQAFGAQLGTVTSRAGQFVGEFTTRDGTTYSIVICGGVFYTLNWNTRAATNVLTAADFSSASITLSATARVFMVVLNDQAIFSDGVNTPWMWDGTTNGGLTSLTACPVLYGQPWVYYLKLFGIKNTERDTVVWSEEGDPATGYETGGYTNAWTLLGAGAFYAGAATNEQMLVVRGRSAQRITGPVSTDFQTAGTRSDVSEEEGTTSPMLVTDNGIVFVNADARPYVIPLGGGQPIQAWEDAAVTIAQVPRASLTSAILVNYTPAKLVLVGLPDVGQTVVTMWLAYRITNTAANLVGLWRGFAADAAGMLLDGSGVPTFVHLGAGDGLLYDHGNPDGTLWDDEFVTGTMAIEHIVEGAPIGASTRVEKLWDLIDIITPAESMTCTLTVTTPNSAGVPASFTVAPSGVQWDVAEWDVDEWPSGSPEIHSALGLNDIGRWMVPTLTHQTSGERFAFTAWQPTAYDASEDYAIR